jgi:two-component system, NtrC family, sensor histidine kinase PilS
MAPLLSLSGTATAPFTRLWHGFLTARIMVAVAILLLQLLIHSLGQSVGEFFVVVCVVYLVVTVATRIAEHATVPQPGTGPHWISTIGIDLAMFSFLQLLQSGSMNYTPLFGLPILLAAVLGSLLLTLGTTAGVTLLLLGDAWWQSSVIPGDSAPRFLQAAVTGTGYFIVAFLVHQLALRLASEGQLAKRSQIAATVQTQVNELVIEALGDGVLVVDMQGAARTANPAARYLLSRPDATVAPPIALNAEVAWQPLASLAAETFRSGKPQTASFSLHHEGHSPRPLHVHTRLTAPGDALDERLCVVFLHDLREMEARLRTEKLAAMGRMSAAVAHEIRNPLAAIAQANALLEEDLQQPAHKQLTVMVGQNVHRLTRIVEDILDIARVQHQAPQATAAPLALDATVEAICHDWSAQAPAVRQLALALDTENAQVHFEPDHLRRILVNLLDNALRYRQSHADSLQVITRFTPEQAIALEVWSDGAPLEQAVEQHLFEPFFSSESRSSGLGLYICRELCDRNGATIAYRRVPRDTARGPQDGNAFVLQMRSIADAALPLPTPTQYTFDL